MTVWRMRTALLGTLGLLLCAPGAVTTPAASAAAHGARETQGDAGIAPVQAVASDSVVGKYGVGIHLGFLDTPYRDADAVASALTDLGVRHVRDDLYPDNPREYAAIRTVAAEGIGFDLIMGRPTSSGTPADYVHTVATQLPAGAVESLEGANEWDISGRDDWVAEVKTWQQRLYTAAKAEPATSDLPVLSPALAFPWNYADVGDLSQYADEANGHMYPGGYVPTNQVTRITNAIRGSIPDKPLVTTEAGYHNATNTSDGHLPVPEDVAGVYLPRLLLEHVLRGEKRVYSYELIDEFDDPGLTDPEAHFGLLRHDLTPKPAYTAMKTLLGLLSDPGPSFTPGSLPVTADGLPRDARYLLTQRRDGRFVLLLWRDVSIYDPQQREKVNVTPDDVTLRLRDAQDLTVYRPSESDAPVRETTGTSLPLQLDGEVTAITIDPVQPPAPTDVTATRGDQSATVSWGLPRTSCEGDRLRGQSEPRVGAAGPAGRRPLLPGHRSGQRQGLRLQRPGPDRRRLVGRRGGAHGRPGRGADAARDRVGQHRPAPAHPHLGPVARPRGEGCGLPRGLPGAGAGRRCGRAQGRPREVSGDDRAPPLGPWGPGGHPRSERRRVEPNRPHPPRHRNTQALRVRGTGHCVLELVRWPAGNPAARRSLDGTQDLLLKGPPCVSSPLSLPCSRPPSRRPPSWRRAPRPPRERTPRPRWCGRRRTRSTGTTATSRCGRSRPGRR